MNVTDHKCPTCGAEPRHHCRRLADGKFMWSWHAARIDVARVEDHAEEATDG